MKRTESPSSGSRVRVSYSHLRCVWNSILPQVRSMPSSPPLQISKTSRCLSNTSEISRVLGDEQSDSAHCDVIPMPTGLTVHTYRSVDLGLPNSNVHSFVRIKVSLDQDFNRTPEAEARSEVWGWARDPFSSADGHLFKPFSSRVRCSPEKSIRSLNDLSRSDHGRYSDVQGAMTGTISLLVEVTSGPHAGHRLEVDVVNDFTDSNRY